MLDGTSKEFMKTFDADNDVYTVHCSDVCSVDCTDMCSVHRTDMKPFVTIFWRSKTALSHGQGDNLAEFLLSFHAAVIVAIKFNVAFNSWSPSNVSKESDFKKPHP